MNPSEMTVEVLSAAVGISPETAQKWLVPLAYAMEQHGIESRASQAAFLANVAHESNLFTAVVENLNYSAEGLLKTWPNRFNAETASQCARNPERIANTVYGGRMGNVEPGDGWKYRGRGLLQITGRANYRQTGDGLGIPLEAEPDLLLDPQYAALSAAWWWEDHNLSELAEVGQFDKLVRIINGGLNGLPHRMVLRETAMEALCQT